MGIPNRRTFLKVLGGASAAAVASGPLFRALANPPAGENEFFVFIHASGGWDVTLWSDPRNEAKGLVVPATSENTNVDAIRLWKDAPFDGEESTFELVRPAGSNLTFGPAIGGLAELYDRLCVINGIAMNTVAHPDGIAFSATGRHLAGGRVPASSIDTMIANELGREMLFPVVSTRFPSSRVGSNVDPRVTPLRVDGIGSVGKVLARVDDYESAADRDAVTALLSEEASALALRAHNPEMFQSMSLQLESLRRMAKGRIDELFDAKALAKARPEFDYKGRYHGGSAVNAAFAVEAMKKNMIRCMSFQLGGFDTHNKNYANQATIQQECFDLIATLVKTLDATPHPTLSSSKLSEHTHILVISEFCRTPQINVTGGRDHQPNNSSLVISPRFKGNFLFGKSDPEQLLPESSRKFSDGERPIAPPDVLATFLGAFGIDPLPYIRDGEVVRELLRS